MAFEFNNSGILGFISMSVNVLSVLNNDMYCLKTHTQFDMSYKILRATTLQSAGDSCPDPAVC